jgi:glycosyltransferase involved in cell wall biosynthesis
MVQQVAVIVPAADEEDRIDACLRALNEARDRLLESELDVDRVDIVVVLDACTDKTPSVVEHYTVEDHVHAITSDARRVGAARQRGVLKAMSLCSSVEHMWLASTDADSTVPSNWLIGMANAANAGFQVVLGTVLPGAELPPLLHAAWSAPHQLTEGHPHIHGANLGIRGDTYLELGGWNAELASNEDIDLASRAIAAPHIHLVRTSAIPVVTSARTIGRAPNGFSSYIRRLRDDHSVPESQHD